MYSSEIDKFLTFLRDIEKEVSINKAIDQESSGETQDLLHSLELEEHTYHEYAKISKRIKEVRQARRKAKDMLEQSSPIIDWIDNHRDVIKSLEALLGSTRKAEKNTDNRIYTPKSKKGKKDNG